MKQQTSAATETRIKGKNIIDFTGKTIYVGIGLGLLSKEVQPLVSL